MNKYFKLILDREFRFNILSSRGFYNKIPDIPYLIKQYKLSYGKEPNIDEPKDFNEKILWLKLYDRRDEYTRFTDKASFRDYIAEKLGEGYTVPLVGGPWKSFDEIDYDSLPQRFVLKCTHDSGGVAVCRDKASFNFARARAKLEKRMRRNYYYGKREWQYKNIEPMIIAEEYIDSEGELFDYKLMCFNGEVKLLLLYSGVVDDTGYRTEEPYSNIFDRDYMPMPFKETEQRNPNPPEKPENWEEMVSVAEKLAEGIPLLRVDMYNVKGKLYVGELTLHHSAGLGNIFDPPEWADILGTWIRLPEKTSRLKD